MSNLDTSKNNGQLALVESWIGTTKQWTQNFRYDPVGRLKEAEERRGDTDALSYKQVFDHDRFGNMYRKAASNPSGGQETPVPFSAIEDGDISKATNRFAAGAVYDEAGNVVQDARFRESNFWYDANGRMVKAAAINGSGEGLSVYDATGLRVAEKVNGVWRYMVYDIGGKCVAEYGGTPSTDEGGVKYMLADWQGSTRAVIGSSGFVRARMGDTD